METLLIEEWLEGTAPILVLDEASLTEIRDRVRFVAAEGGVASDIVDRALVVATELGRNQLRHARAGRVAVAQAVRDGHRGIEITAVDGGEAVPDLAAMMNASARAEGTLGVGIGSVTRLSSEVDFGVRLGEGMRIKARVLPEGAPRRREIGIYGRPHPEERISGDHAAFVRTDDALVLAVCDGLGHGPAAREAATAAMRAFVHHAMRPVPSIFAACETGLEGTRGVVMAVARLEERAPASTVEIASVGNVEVQLTRPRGVRRFGGVSAVLGRRPPPKVRVEATAVGSDEIVVMTTDGISSKLAIEEDLFLLREHPVVIAQRIVERFGRSNDDVLVLVAR